MGELLSSRVRVKRSELCALMEHIYYLRGDTYALSKALCTMYEAMSNGVDLIEGLYEVLFLRMSRIISTPRVWLGMSRWRSIFFLRGYGR